MQRVRAKLEWFKTVILPQEAALRGRLRRILPSTHELEDMVAEVLARAYDFGAAVTRASKHTETGEEGC